MNVNLNKTTAAMIIFAVSVLGYVIMAIWAPTQDYRGLLVFAGTGAAWLGLTGQNQQVQKKAEVIEQKAAETSDKINQIHKQTNGVLDKRIEDGVRKVLTEMFAQHDRDKVSTIVVTRDPPVVKRVKRIKPTLGEN